MINLFRIAARLAAQGDSEPLEIENEKFILNALTEEYKKTHSLPYVSDPKERKRLLEQARSQAKQGEGGKFSKRILDFIESIPGRRLPEAKPERKRFIQWLSQAISENSIPTAERVGIVSDFFRSHGT